MDRTLRAALAAALLTTCALGPAAARAEAPSDGTTLRVVYEPGAGVEVEALLAAWGRRFEALVLCDPQAAAVRVRWSSPADGSLSWAAVKQILEHHDVLVLERPPAVEGGRWTLQAVHRRNAPGLAAGGPVLRVAGEGGPPGEERVALRLDAGACTRPVDLLVPWARRLEALMVVAPAAAEVEVRWATRVEAELSWEVVQGLLSAHGVQVTADGAEPGFLRVARLPGAAPVAGLQVAVFPIRHGAGAAIALTLRPAAGSSEAAGLIVHQPRRPDGGGDELVVVVAGAEHIAFCARVVGELDRPPPAEARPRPGR